MRVYGAWAGDPKGRPEDVTRCVKAVHPDDRGAITHQCSRNRGHGKDGLYCKQHAGDDARSKARNDAFIARLKENDAIAAEAKSLSKALGIDCRAEYNAFARPPRYVRAGVVSFDDLQSLVGRLK